MEYIFKIHLNELKIRTIYIIFSFFSSFIICFYYKVELFYFISKKFLLYNIGFIYTKLTEPFVVYFKLSLFFAFFTILFIIFYFYSFFFFKSLYNFQIKKIILFISIFYFFLIVFIKIVFKYIIPILFKILLLFQTLDLNSVMLLTLEAKLEDYFSLFYYFIVFLFLLIHIPLVLFLFISKIKSLNIIKLRKYIYIFFFIIFIFLAPPDIWIQIIILPILICFIEFCIFYFHLIYNFKI